MLRRISLTVLAIALILSLGNLNAETKGKSKTLDNLQAAFNGESNANAKYLAYAKKADEEGYKQVASLFRAAAKAEEIHKTTHSTLIKKLGAVPKADIKTPAPKSTKENLQDALTGETYEKDKMYPDFIAQAKIEKNKDAVKAFNGAKAAETEHAKLYAGAIKNLDKMKVKAAYFVCPVCGYTVAKIGFDKCPVCYTEKGKFLKID